MNHRWAYALFLSHTHNLAISMALSRGRADFIYVKNRTWASAQLQFEQTRKCPSRYSRPPCAPRKGQSTSQQPGACRDPRVWVLSWNKSNFNRLKTSISCWRQLSFSELGSLGMLLFLLLPSGWSREQGTRQAQHRARCAPKTPLGLPSACQFLLSPHLGGKIKTSAAKCITNDEAWECFFPAQKREHKACQLTPPGWNG